MNNTTPEWQWNELAGIGGFHNNEEVAAGYDDFHKGFRDIDAENKVILEQLDPKEHQALLDLGAGTGLFTLAAAKRYAKVYAVDIAQPMLARAQEKARQAGLTNIEFCEGGFLTYRHEGEPVDVVISQMALHHLPDVWKYVALVRMAAMLKPGGTLCLRDTVFSGLSEDYAAFFDTLLEPVSGDMKTSIARHIRTEYTAVDWIMEGLLTRAGFSIRKAEYKGNFLATYLCTKETKS